MQGVTELTECERIEKVDGGAWLQAVQEEFRRYEVSEDTHAFLHGLPTSVPGSWLAGEVLCGNARCQALVDHGRKRSRHDAASNKGQIKKKACSFCQSEREKRRLVAGNAENRGSQKKDFLIARPFLQIAT